MTTGLAASSDSIARAAATLPIAAFALRTGTLGQVVVDTVPQASIFAIMVSAAFFAIR